MSALHLNAIPGDVLQAFWDLPLLGALNYRVNFQTFPAAMLVLLRIATTDNWCVDCGLEDDGADVNPPSRGLCFNKNMHPCAQPTTDPSTTQAPIIVYPPSQV